MLIIYTPEGGERREWTFKPRKILSAEAMAIERVTGLDWGEVSQRFMNGSVRARTAVLWVLRKRSEPQLKFADVEYALDELDVRYDTEELDGIREQVQSRSDLTDDEKAAVMEALTPVDDDDQEQEPAGEGEGPKESSAA